MKIVLEKDHYLHIHPETHAEEIALNTLLNPDGEVCGACGQNKKYPFLVHTQTEDDHGD